MDPPQDDAALETIGISTKPDGKKRTRANVTSGTKRKRAAVDDTQEDIEDAPVSVQCP